MYWLNVLLLCFAAIVSCTHSESILVVHDGTTDFDEYKLFINDLAETFSDHELVYHDLSKDAELKLVSDVDSSNNLYHKVVIFPSSGKKTTSKKLNALDLVKFTSNENGNVFVIDSSQNSNADVRVFLNQLGIYPSPKNYKFFDNFHTADDESDLLSLPLSESLTKESSAILGNTLKKDDILYDGSSALLSNNELLIPIVKGSKTSFNYNSKKSKTGGSTNRLEDENVWAVGSQNFLIVAMQNLVNSRVSWIGSSEFLKDSLITKSNYKNLKIAKDLATWTFGGKSVLKIDFVEFYKTSNNTFNSKLSHDTFKVKDEVVYNLAVSEYKDGKWQPYLTDDLQLEFVMLDPYYRLNLKPISSDSKQLSVNDAELSSAETNKTFYSQQIASDLTNSQFYTTKFNLPDQHGMFKFLVKYQKPSYSFLTSENIVVLRNLANDEYEKSWSIVNSWVYLSSIGTLIAGWFIFLNLFLFTAEKKVVPKKDE